MAFIARNYGFKYYDKEQLLREGVKLYPSAYFAGYPSLETKMTFAIHFCCGSWRRRSSFIKLKNFVRKILFILKNGSK